MTDNNQPHQAPSGKIDRRLLEILVCPVTKSALILNESHNELISPNAGLAFPIREGIPIMLADEARELSDDEVTRWKK